MPAPEDIARLFRHAWILGVVDGDSYSASAENLSVHLASCEKCDHESLCERGTAFVRRLTVDCKKLLAHHAKELPKRKGFFVRLRRALDLIR